MRIKGSYIEVCFLVLIMACGRFIVADDVVPIAAADCPVHTSFESEHYVIRRAYVEDPFSFLRWLKPVVADANTEVSFLNGHPYSLAAVRKGVDALDKLVFLGESNEASAVMVTVVAVENCKARQLDLVYQIYSTRISPILTTTLESRSHEKEAPQEQAGVTQPPALRFQPLAGYNRSDDLFGGARIEAHAPPSTHLPFHSLVIEGWGSTSAHSATIALAGSHDPEKTWLQHAEWQLNYSQSESPTDVHSLQKGRLAGAFAGASRPSGSAGWTLRFGGKVEGGNLQSGFSSIDLAPNTIASAGYGAIDLYAGTTARTRHQVFSASYGLELGSTGGGAQIDWRKHVGDVAHEFWYPIGNHRLIEIDSRFTAGGIQIPGSIPLAARFFGGNREQEFVPGDTWKIRANPVIRSIPANRFYRSADGPGAESFSAYNLTAAYSIWRRPVVPQEILNDPEFLRQVNGGLTSAISTVTVTYLAKDKHFKESFAHIQEVRDSVTRFETAVKAAEAVHPGQFLQDFKLCKSALVRAGQRATSAAEAKSADAYGDVAALLNSDPTGDENRLQKVDVACVAGLNGKLNDPAIATEGAKLGALANVMQQEFDQIDQARAAAQAEQEMSYVKTTLQTLLHDVNLYSISPVAVFDLAHIGPANATLGGTRYGAGGGLRFTLVSAASFTFGYAWNIHAHPDEGRGALFFALKFRDLFQ
jgi:hypothetical protein